MSEWRDISTAPKDGTRFLAFEVIGPMDEYDDDDNLISRGKFERGCVVAYHIDFGFGGGVVPYPWNGGVSQNVNYTHWMPLPPAPIPTEGAKLRAPVFQRCHCGLVNGTCSCKSELS